MKPDDLEAVEHRSLRFLARLAGEQEGSTSLAAQMSAADVPDLLDEIGRLQRDVDRLQCRSVYMECEKYDRRCVDDRGHERNGSRLHMNRAGFAWSDKEAAESLDRVYPALPAPSPSAELAGKATTQADHLAPCGCLINDADAHRVGCPEYPEGKR